MDDEIRILKKVLARVTAMTLEEYHTLYDSVVDVPEIKLATRAFSPLSVEYLPPHNKDGERVARIYKEQAKHARYTFSYLSENYGVDKAYSVA